MSDNSWVTSLDGLPPAGTVCEINPGYKKAKITYMGEGVGCYIDLSSGIEFTFSTSSYTFRPIKTERELAIEEMARDLNIKFNLHDQRVNCEMEVTLELGKDILGKLYDAGYRKNES